MSPGRLRRVPRGLGRRARVAVQALEMRRFRTRVSHDSDAPLLLLSPHWDDAVFNCWSLLTSEREVRVINVFAGIPPGGAPRRWDRICGASEASSHARRRTTEDAQALLRTGRTPVNVPLLDAEYREPGPDPSLDDLDRAVRDSTAAGSEVYAPAALGTNVDHRLVRRYARGLHAQGMPVHLYADVPYCVAHGWPHWVDGDDPDSHRDVDVFWRTFLVDVPELGDLRAATVARLGAEDATAKLSAMRTYRTQFSALDGGGVLSNPGIHGFEVFWTLE
jgi:hypothetical protein